MANDMCQEFNRATKKSAGIPATMSFMDKRYGTQVGGNEEHLGPDDRYYRAHCGYCAETDFINRHQGEDGKPDEFLRGLMDERARR